MARPSPEQIDKQSFGGLDIEILEAEIKHAEKTK
jgi:hypothetical protein